MKTIILCVLVATITFTGCQTPVLREQTRYHVESVITLPAASGTVSGRPESFVQTLAVASPSGDGIRYNYQASDEIWVALRATGSQEFIWTRKAREYRGSYFPKRQHPEGTRLEFVIWADSPALPVEVNFEYQAEPAPSR